MHELGIMYHVVEQVQKVMADNGLAEVEAIVLQVGELSAVIPKYLENCFPAAVDGTPLKNTKLEIEILPANCICRKCGKVSPLHPPQESTTEISICPNCGETAREIISGKEFYIKEIRAR